MGLRLPIEPFFLGAVINSREMYKKDARVSRLLTHGGTNDSRVLRVYILDG